MATFAEERAHAKTTGNVGRGREENVREREEERERDENGKTTEEERVRKKLMSLRVCAVECNGRGKRRKYRGEGFESAAGELADRTRERRKKLRRT